MIRKIFLKIISPLSKNEDLARSEFILNVLLLTSVGLSFITFSINFTRWFLYIPNSVPFGMPFFTLCFFLFLFVLSRKGFYRTAAYCLLATFFILVSIQIYMWGADLPSALLSYVLIIVMAGVLINTRVAFITTFLIAVTLSVIAHFQFNSSITFDSHWKDKFDVSDVIIFVVLFSIIATVSWLSNREIERSLARARRSEVELKKERDSLEIKVEEKTRQLKESQAEKMSQLYRFAEFGRLSSGIFHDLINPLSAVSLSMERLKSDSNTDTAHVRDYVDRAVLATKKMEDLVVAVRKQLSREENRSLFSVDEEIKQVIKILTHKASGANVKIDFITGAGIEIFGDAIKFHYAVLNILINAVDSYVGLDNKQNRNVVVSLKKQKNNAVVEIKDSGSGIRPENLDKIFESFFTTKAGSKGIGIGLSMTKRIIEKDFSGTIDVKSQYGKGTTFNISIPIKLEN